MTLSASDTPRTLYFSRLFKNPVRIEGSNRKLGKASDLVFALQDPAPLAVGVFLDHGWNAPSEFIPMERVRRMDERGIEVMAPSQGEQYPPFEDQPGWILADKHLMGRTILDIDDRDVEVVNDVLLTESEGGWHLTAVDASLNGFFRKWGLLFLTSLVKDDLIAWKWVQPLSVEDAVATDKLQLSVTKDQLHDLPIEDLADALEELSGQEQEALFSALELEKAADALSEAEPRAQRQIIAHLRQERAQNILASLSTPQLVDLLSVLPHEDAEEMLELLPEQRCARIRALMSERETTARDFMSMNYLTVNPDLTVSAARALVRNCRLEYHDVSYLYVLDHVNGTLCGVVDARQLLMAEDDATMGSLMADPVVATEADDTREDVETMFNKYHYRMIPVVDPEDHILGVIRFNEIMKSTGKA